MKKVFTYIISFVKEEIKWGYFISVVAFAGICIFLQYKFKLSHHYVDYYRKDFSFLFRAFILYAIPFIGTLSLYSVFHKKWTIWLNPHFIMLIGLTLITYVWRCDISLHTTLVKNFVDPSQQRYWQKVGTQLMHGIILFPLPFLWWWFMDKKEKPFYGWQYKNISFTPYFLILLILTPFIIIASTQPDFLRTYPKVASILKDEPQSLLTIAKAGLFELTYAFDFLMNEFFFRGFIILAFIPFLGRGIIIPMAVFYIFIHFGKPLGETISSFFGGIALGIITYETRSIYGGVIIHIGIAWLMEIAAFIGRTQLHS